VGQHRRGARVEGRGPLGREPVAVPLCGTCGRRRRETEAGRRRPVFRLRVAGAALDARPSPLDARCCRLRERALRGCGLRDAGALLSTLGTRLSTPSPSACRGISGNAAAPALDSRRCCHARSRASCPSGQAAPRHPRRRCSAFQHFIISSFPHLPRPSTLASRR